MIYVGEDSFEVLVNRSTDSHELFAEVDLLPSTPFTVAELIANERLEGSRLALESQDFVTADTELRSVLLANNLDFTTTQYWYKVENTGVTEDLYLEDIDPETHTVITIGNHTRSFSPKRASTTDFIRDLLASGLCEGCCWNGSLLEVSLPAWLVTDEERAQTFRAILGLYRPGD